MGFLLDPTAFSGFTMKVNRKKMICKDIFILQ